MSADSGPNSSNFCRIHVSHEDEWVRAVVSLDGAHTGGRLVETTPDYFGGIEGIDEIAAPYTLTNWLAGITSGALYCFRALRLPRRRVFLSELSGSMRASGMQALANASAVGVARLFGRDPPPLNLDGWHIDCEVSSPATRPGADHGDQPRTVGGLPSPSTANGKDTRQMLVSLVFQALVDGGISDPDVRLINSIMHGDAKSQKASLESGADPDVTESEVIHRHSDSLTKPPVSEMLAAAVVRMLTPHTSAAQGTAFREEP